MITMIKEQFSLRERRDTEIQIVVSHPHLHHGYYTPIGALPFTYPNIEQNLATWVCSFLDQVIQSTDERFLMSDSLRIIVTLIKTDYQVQGRTINSSKSYCHRRILNRQSHVPEMFKIQVEHGFLESALLFDDWELNSNCLPLSVYTGLIWEQCQGQIIPFVRFCLNKFKSANDMNQHFLTKYHINDSHLSNLSLRDAIEFISHKIQRKIIYFVKKNQQYFQLLDSTAIKRTDSRPLVLVIQNNHASYIFELKNLERPNSHFCVFCTKSVPSLLMHSCKRSRCPNCLLYKFPIKQGGVTELICSKENSEERFLAQCVKCHKFINNRKCFQRHQNLTKAQCMSTQFCISCNKNFIGRNHECNQTFCKQCFSFHDRTDYFCQTNVTKKQSRSNRKFILNIYNSTDGVFWCLSEVQFQTCSFTLYLIYKSECIELQVDENFNFSNQITKQLNVPVDDVFDLITLFNLNNDKIGIFMDTPCLHFCLSNIDLTNWTVKTKDTMCYQANYKGLTLNRLDDILSTDSLLLLNKLDFPSCNPLFLILPKAIKLINNATKLSFLDFNAFLDSYKSSNINLLQYLETYKMTVKDTICNLTKYDFILHYLKLNQFIFQQSLTHLHSILNNLYDDFSIDNNSLYLSPLDASSLASAIFPLFLDCLHNSKQPITNSHSNGQIYCTSKAEICLALTISQVHKHHFPGHKIWSFVDNDGVQFQINNYSADWFCETCSILVQVEGNFKRHCAVCKPKVKNTEKQRQLELLSTTRRKRFCDLIIANGHPSLQTYVVTQCCIESNNLQHDFKQSILYSNEFDWILKNNLQNYSRETFQRLNYQNCISSSIKCELATLYLSKSAKSKCMKFDICSAFIKCLELQDFRIPTSHIPKQYLVGPEADMFFKSLSVDDKNFAFIRTFIICPRENVLPFMPIRDKQGRLLYSICSKCTNDSLNCKHTDLERGFWVDSYLIEINFLRQLGYQIVQCSQIIYFESFHNIQFAALAKGIRLSLIHI